MASSVNVQRVQRTQQAFIAIILSIDYILLIYCTVQYKTPVITLAYFMHSSSKIHSAEVLVVHSKQKVNKNNFMFPFT